MADQKNNVYYFEDTGNRGVLWVDLKAIDFQPGTGVRKLTLYGHPELGGNQTANFRPAGAFTFLAPN